jgi:hypothetical protein
MDPPVYVAVRVALPLTGTVGGPPVMVSFSFPGGTTGTVLLWPLVGLPSGPGEVEATGPIAPGTVAVATTLPTTGLLTVTEQVPAEV